MLKLEAEIEAARHAGDLPRARGLATEYLAHAGRPKPSPDAGCEPWFRARYIVAQVELAAGFPARSAAHLEALLPSLPELTEELASRIRLLAAEVFARTGRHAESRVNFAPVPTDLLGSHPLLRMRAVRVRLMLGELHSVQEELVMCERALGEDRANLAVLACEEGRAWEAEQDLDRAGRCWERADVFTRRLGLHPARADALVQLGRLKHLRGRFSEAAEKYDEAMRAAGGGPFAPEIAWRRVLLRLDLGEDHVARREADELCTRFPVSELPDEVRLVAAVALAVLHGTAWEDAPAELRGYLASAAGDSESAAAWYAQALAAAPAAERQARLSLAMGIVSVDRGQHGEAVGWLVRAEELARNREMPEVLARALESRGQLVAEQTGDEDTARALFEEAVRVAEVEAARSRNGLDRAGHRWRRSSVLRRLIRSAARRNDPAAVFRYQELERGRFLLDLLDVAGRASEFTVADLVAVQQELADCEARLYGPAPDLERELRQREEILLRRDRLHEEYLGNRTRSGDSLLPSIPALDNLRRALPPGSLYLAPALVGDDLVLLGVSSNVTRVVCRAGAALELNEQLEAWRGLLGSQVARYRTGFLDSADRRSLDTLLERIGRGPLGTALAEFLESPADRPQRVIWIPDGPLHGFPIHALRRGGKYLVETVPFAWSFGGSLLVWQARNRSRRRWWRPITVVATDEADLPGAADEARVVASGFWRSRVLGPGAKRTDVLRQVTRSRLAHFACHAVFDRERPFASAVVLPSNDRVTALEWLAEPVDGVGLITLSACRSAEVGPVLGREVFGLVTGLLGAGVRSVLAGLWPLPDRETRDLITAFYLQRRVTDLATAIAAAQREAIADPALSPFHWAGMVLHGDADGISPDSWLARVCRRVTGRA